MQRPGQMWTRRAFVSKPNLCSRWWKFDARSRCWVEKRPHINDQQFQSPAAERHAQLFSPDSFLTPALVRSYSEQAQFWRGLVSFVGFIPMIVMAVTKRILTATTVYFPHGVGGDFHYRYMIQSLLDCKHEPLYCFYLFWSGVQSFGTAFGTARIILGCPFTFSNLQVFHCNADCLKVF